jgi:outer membrane receptor protein involved in Fe transport
MISLTSASVLAMSLTATGAAAQSAAAQDAVAGGTTVGEIVVTASKREQKLRDVPSAITVLGGDQIENLGIQSVRDYATLTPGLTVQDNGAPGYGKIFIRGLTTGTLQQSATTVFYIDDVPFTSSSANGGGAFIAPDPELTDIDRIEVLKGPQGTLYGASSLGGVIRLISKRPDPSHFSGTARAEMTAIDGGGVGGLISATVNLPLVTDQLALRVTGFGREAPGYVDNVGTGTDNVNKSAAKGARIAVGWTANDRLTVDLVGQIENIDTDGPTLQQDVSGAFTPVYGARKYSNFFDAPTEVRYRLVSATGKYDVGVGHVTATAAYLESRLHIESDVTPSYAAYFPLLGLFGYNYPVGTGAAVESSVPLKKTTAELRFASKRLGPVEFVVGGFYTHEDVLGPTQVVARDMATNTQLPAPLGVIASAPVDDTYEEVSAFGNFTYYLTNDLDLTGGVRLAHNKEDFTLSYSGALYDVLLGGPVQIPPTHSSADKLTYLTTLRWRPTRTLSMFLRAASGYRPGGPQVAPVVPPGAQTQIDPDTVWNYEAGVKGDFLENRLSIEASAYHIDWDNIQLYTVYQNLQLLANAGKAKVDGFEVQATARPTPLLTIGANLGYTDPRIAEVDPGVTAVIGAAAGDPIPQTPNWTGAVTVDQQIPLGDELQGRIGATARLQSHMFTSFPGSLSSPNVRLPGFATVDLRAGVTYKNYQLQVRAENIFDQAGMTNYTPGAPAFANLIRPRSFTVSLSTEF